MFHDDEAKLAELIAEYKRLRCLLDSLDAKAEETDQRLIEIERALPEDNDLANAFRNEPIFKDGPT
jgi:prefoldin subunit 5